MKRGIILRPEAERELAGAYRWYEGKRPGLGEDFLLTIEAALSEIARNPERFPLVHKNVRRALTRRFPYGIYYIPSTDRVLILAVFHGRRDPAGWKNR